jgi:hypothetical protein
MIREITDAIKTNFDSIQKAISFFADDASHIITNMSFRNAITSIFPKRFQENDIQQLWNKI